MNTHFYREHRVLGPLLVIAAFFVIDLVVAVAGMGWSLSQARAAAGDEERDLSERFGSLSSWGGRAAWFSGHPAYRIAAAAVPDLALASHLADLAADAGSEAGEAYRALGGGDAASVYSNGRVDLGRIEIAHRHLQRSISLLDRGSDALEAEGRALLGATREIVRETQDRLAEARSTADGLEALLGSLPRMLGGDRERTYLLAFQSPSEARGGGGLIGVTAELRAIDGDLSLGQIRTVRELVRRMSGRVEAPGWFERTYGPLLSTREWRTANASPNFPVTSEVISRMYERSTGTAVDGVIAMDPLTLSSLTDAVGPLQAEGWDVVITKDNARRVLLHDVYRHFHFVEHRQNRYLASLLDRVWEAIGSGDAEPDALAAALGDSVGKQHLKIFAGDQDEQDALHAVGASGAYDADEPVQMLFNNNWSANKIDFFLHRSQDVRIRLRSDGSARVTTEVRLENKIEDLDRNVIARPGIQRGLPVGLNRTLLSLLMPEEAERARMFIDGTITSPIPGHDGSHPMVSQFVDVPPGGSVVVAFSYDWPGAIRDGAFELTLHPQATARPDRVSVSLAGPAGDEAPVRTAVLKRPLVLSHPLDRHDGSTVD